MKDMALLEALRRGPADGAATLLVVLCHGVGADGHDLIGLADSWAPALPQAAFLAPDAPEPCDMAPVGAAGGRQWFSLQDRTPAVLEAGARRATPLLLATVAAELTRLGLPDEAVVLMGFSQGAMMVLHAGLRRETPPCAILAYSGALLAGPALEAELSGRPPILPTILPPVLPPVLLVHGEDDEVVPFARGPAAAAALRRLGVTVTTKWQPGVGHWIDEAGLRDGAAFMQALPAAITDEGSQ